MLQENENYMFKVKDTLQNHYLNFKDNFDKYSSLEDFLHDDNIKQLFNIKFSYDLKHSIDKDYSNSIVVFSKNTIWINPLMINPDYSINYVKIVCIYMREFFGWDNLKLLSWDFFNSNKSILYNLKFLGYTVNLENILRIILPIENLKNEWNNFNNLLKSNNDSVKEVNERFNLMLNYLSYKFGYSKVIIYQRLKEQFPSNLKFEENKLVEKQKSD